MVLPIMVWKRAFRLKVFDHGERQTAKRCHNQKFNPLVEWMTIKNIKYYSGKTEQKSSSCDPHTMPPDHNVLGAKINGVPMRLNSFISS
jgi:hypothetical protein